MATGCMAFANLVVDVKESSTIIVYIYAVVFQAVLYIGCW